MSELPRKSSNLLGVVLCGGQSLRMGRDKAGLAHPRGGTFLQHAIERLAQLCDTVAVSTAPTSCAEIPAGVLRIDDPTSHRGPMIGVAASLHAAKKLGLGGCLVTPVDTPDLTISDLRCLEDAWQSNSSIVCAVEAESEKLQPLIAIYGATWETSLKQSAEGEDRSLYRWLRQHDPGLVSLPSSSCQNINRPEDLPF